MALRREYALGHSQYNEFLFSFVGEEKGGQRLTVLSALARLDIDPWNEAARLAGLSREAATQALATIIGSVPAGDWAVSDAPSIAARLIDDLHKRRTTASIPPPSAPPSSFGAKAREATSGLPKWVLWLAFAAALMLAATLINAAGEARQNTAATVSERMLPDSDAQ